MIFLEAFHLVMGVTFKIEHSTTDEIYRLKI